MSNTTYTPYKAAGVVNKQLAEDGFDKKLPPQMFYTYTKKGYIPSFEVNGKRLINEIDLMVWYASYKQKNLLGGQSNNADTNTEEVDENQLDLFDTNEEPFEVDDDEGPIMTEIG